MSQADVDALRVKVAADLAAYQSAAATAKSTYLTAAATYATFQAFGVVGAAEVVAYMASVNAETLGIQQTIKKL